MKINLLLLFYLYKYKFYDDDNNYDIINDCINIIYDEIGYVKVSDDNCDEVIVMIVIIMLLVGVFWIIFYVRD